MNPTDTNFLHGYVAVAVARAATAHNDGETVLAYRLDGPYEMSLKMSSWPRAKEAERAFHEYGWETRIGANDMGQWIHVRTYNG